MRLVAIVWMLENANLTRHRERTHAQNEQLVYEKENTVKHTFAIIKIAIRLTSNGRGIKRGEQCNEIKVKLLCKHTSCANTHTD